MRTPKLQIKRKRVSLSSNTKHALLMKNNIHCISKLLTSYSTHTMENKGKCIIKKIA